MGVDLSNVWGVDADEGKRRVTEYSVRHWRWPRKRKICENEENVQRQQSAETKNAEDTREVKGMGKEQDARKEKSMGKMQDWEKRGDVGEKKGFQKQGPARNRQAALRRKLLSITAVCRICMRSAKTSPRWSVRTYRATSADNAGS
jgi:hypothetical protein